MRKKAIAAMILVMIFSTGCFTSAKKAILPVYDDVLIYPISFDLAYLRTLEALESLPDWELEETEKEKGMIVARNVNFKNFGDQDKRLAVFMIKRLDRSQTSIQLAPHTQSVTGGDDLLKQVSKYVSREL